MSLFVRLRGPTTHGALWRLGPAHVVAVMSFFARQWGEISYVSFPRTREGRLLGYGTITFTDHSSVQRVLQAAMQRHGLLRIPFAAPPADPEAISYASLADCERASTTSPSLRDSVAMNAPLAPSTKDDAQDYFFVTVERSERPLYKKPSRPPASRPGGFDGFAGGWAQNVQKYAHQDKESAKSL